MDFRVTPPTEINRDLVGEGLPVATVGEVVFLEQRALVVVVGHSFCFEPAAHAFAVAIARPKVRAVGPRPVRFGVDHGTLVVVRGALAGEFGVVTGVLEGVSTLALAGEVVTDARKVVGVVDADRGTCGVFSIVGRPLLGDRAIEGGGQLLHADE